ncbi:MAG: hypothetical protein V4729_02305 [Pseudomonadota bacterium]
MFGWKQRDKSVAASKDDAEIERLNAGLSLAMEWGSNWLKPIQERLAAQYPELTVAELDRYNEVCREAMKAGHDLVYSMAESQGKEVDSAAWQAAFLSRYAWPNKDNLSKLFSQGMYYAWKDGVGR